MKKILSKEECMDVLSRLENIESKLSVLEAVVCSNSKKYQSVLELDLILPEDDIDGLHFNETKVHAVFEKQDDGWYHSRDILFLSAWNTEDDNSRDILTEYLNCHGYNGLKKQLAGHFDVHPQCIKIALPKENEGVKQYNGVNHWYWLTDKYSGSAAHFCNSSHYGGASYYTASAVGGCAPAFCVA
jgi:hypothetical protein